MEKEAKRQNAPVGVDASAGMLTVSQAAALLGIDPLELRRLLPVYHTTPLVARHMLWLTEGQLWQLHESMQRGDAHRQTRRKRKEAGNETE